MIHEWRLFGILPPVEVVVVAFAAVLVVEVEPEPEPGAGLELVAAVGEQEKSSRQPRIRSRIAPPFLVVRYAIINNASQLDDK